MTANLDQFTHALDQLLEGHAIKSSNPALQSATALLSLDIDAESAPPAKLRARWVSDTKPVMLERKSFMQALHARPIVALLIALLILLALSGVVYALGRAFGYIPGIGLVDQSAPIRVLAGPVSQTRDGITITVNDVVLTPQKTVVVYTVENIPADELSRQVNVPGCGASFAEQAQLKLPNGTLQPMKDAYGLDGWATGYKVHFAFAPIPSDVNEATLVVPCISGALPGMLPEQWEFHLRFILAPPEMTVIPVIEVTPSPEATNRNPLALENVIETDNGYILAGTFSSVGMPQDARAVQFSQFPLITDASGQNVLFNLANYQLDLPAEQTAAGIFPWAFEIVGKQFAWPLTITVNSVAAEYPNAQAKFEFDAGASPQEGQEWDLDLDIDLAGFPVRVLKAFRTVDGYSFNFESETMFHGVNLSIGDSVQGLTGMDDPNHFSSSVTFAGAIPSGKLPVLVTHPVVAVSGSWQLQWQPEHPPTIPSPTETAQTCLTLDSWKSAIANPQPLPADLTGRLLAYGPLSEDYLNYDNYGSFMINLDGSNRQTITQGIYPSLSPDGKYIAFAWDQGLNIFDLMSGEQHRIPNTTTADNVPMWSPDGTKIAFTHGDDLNLYIINSDGSGLTRAVNENGDEQLVGWTSDGMALYYGVTMQDGIFLRKVDIASGTVTEQFVIKNRRGYEDIDISPDGNRVAFHERENLSDAVYVSNLDGSNRRLIAQMGQWVMIAPFWSPDGKWLMVVVLPTDLPDQPSELALVNLQDCRVIPLAWRAQSIHGWIP